MKRADFIKAYVKRCLVASADWSPAERAMHMVDAEKNGAAFWRKYRVALSTATICTTCGGSGSLWRGDNVYVSCVACDGAGWNAPKLDGVVRSEKDGAS